MKQKLDLEFERAIRFLVNKYPPSNKNSRKPILAHALRVGTFFYRNKYPREIILAGLLHDVLEFSKTTAYEFKKIFGAKILKLVKACTKDDSISDPREKTEELIKRCARAGKAALIVKTADILDSFEYYTAMNKKDQLDYCQRNARAILKFKSPKFNDKIFCQLEKWI